jgi:surface carbohydrate biosynthesis protein
MNTSASTLIVPVETQVRELDAKLLLSCVAAERGFPVIMGSRAFIHFKVSSMPRGLYLAKSMRTLSIRMFDILRRLGHEIVAWDEEGLLREPDAEYYRWRLSPETMGRVSHLIAWGADDARVLNAYPGYHGAPIHITGNPRIDLMRSELKDYYQPQVDDIRRRFGKFVLVNTNFSKVNHFFTELSPLKKAMEAKNPQDVNSYDAGWGHHKLALFNHFQQMLAPLCETLSDCTVVIRPHPAENHKPWNTIAEKWPNLYVANDGSITPWLMATEAVIANSCTTQVEAAVLDTPSVSFMPVVSDKFDHKLPNGLSHRVGSVDQLCRTVQSIVDGELGPLDYQERRKHLDPHIASLEGPLAADRMVDALEQGGYRQRKPPAPPVGKYAQGWIRNRVRTVSKHINMRRPGHRNNLAYHAHRWPDISVEEIENRIARLGGLLNRFDRLRVKPYSQHIFKISG